MWLAAILFFGILTQWIPAQWPLSAFQAALFATAAARIVRRRSVGHHVAGWILAAAVAWGLLQIAAHWTVDVSATLEAVLDWLANLAAFALALDFYQKTHRRERFLRTTLIFAAALAIVSIFTVLTSQEGRAFWIFETGSEFRTLGPFVYHNQYAAFVEAVLPLAMIGVMRRGFRWVPYAATAALLFGSVVAGGSRAGSILCFAEILAIPALAYFRGKWNGRTVARAIGASLAAVVLLTAVVGWENLWQRLQEPNPYSLRWNLVRSSFAMIRDRPVTGFGLGTWSEAYPAYALFDDGRFVNQAHNDWVQWAAEGGIPFFAMLFALGLWSVRPALRTLWGIGVVSVFLHALVDYPFQQRPALAAFFFAMLGTLAATAARKARPSNPHPAPSSEAIPAGGPIAESPPG